MVYMIIENFRNHDPRPVYRRFQERGRLCPDGVTYLSSWVDVEFVRCFQLMQTDDRSLLDEWMENWKDLVDFEVVPVVTSSEALQTLSENHTREPRSGAIP